MMNTKYFEKVRDELLAQNCSRKTVQTYNIGLMRFSKFIKKPFYKGTLIDINKFKIYLLKSLEPKTVNTYLASVLFLYREILNRKIKVKTVKEKIKIPRILNNNQIKKMISLTENKKHQLLLTLLYSSGLRVGEAVKLKYEDIDFQGKAIVVRQGKGRKDRRTIASNLFLDNINEGKGYVFPGRKDHLSIRSAQEIVKQAGKRIERNIHPHLLRHSFATHMIQNGSDISNVKEYVGHSSIRTTEKYIHHSRDYRQIKTPMD